MMPPLHDPNALLEGILWPFKITGAVILAFLALDYIHDKLDDMDDPDGFA